MKTDDPGDNVETNILKKKRIKARGFLNLSSIVPLNDSNGNIFITKILCFFKARIYVIVKLTDTDCQLAHILTILTMHTSNCKLPLS